MRREPRELEQSRKGCGVRERKGKELILPCCGIRRTFCEVRNRKLLVRRILNRDPATCAKLKDLYALRQADAKVGFRH